MDHGVLRWLLQGPLGLRCFPGSLVASLSFSSEPILYSYLQIVGSLLCFTYAANAMVAIPRHARPQNLILAFGSCFRA